MSDSPTEELTQTILSTISDKKPPTIKELIALVAEKYVWTEPEIIDAVSKLQASSKIALTTSVESVDTYSKYIMSSQGLWFRLTLLVSILTAVTVFFISENLYPWSLVRNLLGLIFVLWMPGYVFVRALFPVDGRPLGSLSKISNVERVVLSIVMSLVLVALIGFILNFSPLGISLLSMVCSLLVFNLVASIVAAVKEFSLAKKALGVF